MKQTKKTVAIYARVSTDKQAVDMQIHELKQYIKKRSWKLTQVYKDQGFTGTNTKRPAFSEMMTAARQRNFDILLVWKLDRFGRSLKDLVNTLGDLEALGIDFVSYHDNNLDTTTPTGKLVFHVMASVAEFERDIISERIKAGLDNAKRKGKKLGRSPLPLYVIQEAKELRKQGLSNRKIAKQLKCSESAIRQNLPKQKS